MTPPPDSPAKPQLRRSPAAVAVSMAIANAGLWGFTLLASAQLGPEKYGALAAMMAMLLVVSVLQLGLQTTAARRIAADPQHVAQIEREVLAVTYRLASALGFALVVFSPVLAMVLHLDHWAMPMLVAAAVVPITVQGGQLGILQGERRWWPCAAVLIASGLPRLVLGAALIWWRPTEVAAMTGVALGAVPAMLLGIYALRRPRAEKAHSDSHTRSSIIREIAVNSQALLGFLALINADMVVARNALTEQQSGLYAGGLILVKAVLFLPQFVVILAFPAMSTAHERRRALILSLGLVTALGACATLATAVLPSLALRFVGGSEYAAIESDLWIFAILGTVLSLLQLLVYSVLARRGSGSVYLLWAALAIMVLVGLQQHSLVDLLVTVIIVDAMLFAALLIASLYRLRNPLPSDDEPLIEPAL